MNKLRRALRWLGFRFTIRALLLATLLLSVVCSWWVSQTRLAMRQQAAVNRIRELGGNVTYEYQLDATRRGQPPPLPPAFIQRFTGAVIVSDVVKVTWQATRAGDDHAKQIGRLSKLKDLRLSSDQFTDDAIESLSGLHQLRRLDLWCSQVTDKSLAHLGDLQSLQRLDLYNTQVSDAGLTSLHGLKNLKELKLRNTRVTAAGAANLQAALPQCKVLGVPGWPPSKRK